MQTPEWSYEPPNQADEANYQKKGAANSFDELLHSLQKTYTFKAAEALRERGGINGALQNLKELSKNDPVLAPKYQAIESLITERNQLYENYDTTKLNDVNTCLKSILDTMHNVKIEKHNKQNQNQTLPFSKMVSNFQANLQGKNVEEVEKLQIESYSAFQETPLFSGDTNYDKAFVSLLNDEGAQRQLAQLLVLDPAAHQKIMDRIELAKDRLGQ